MGIHEISASKKGYYTLSKTATVNKDSSTIIDFELEPIPEIDRGTIKGTVTDINTRNAIVGAFIVTDGGYGITNQDGNYVISEVPVGDRNVRAHMKGYYSVSKTATVNKNEEVAINFQLSQIVIPPYIPRNWTVPDCKLCINGYAIGMTPERLTDLPWWIWINKINEKTTVRPTEIRARNDNMEGAIGLSDALALAFTKSLGLGDVLKLKYKTNINLEIVSLKSILEDVSGKEIPNFKIWTGSFDPEQIYPDEISKLSLNSDEVQTSLSTTIGISLPEVTGGLGGLIFAYGPYTNQNNFNCLWFIPLAYSEVDGGNINIVLPPLPGPPPWPGIPKWPKIPEGGSTDRNPPTPVITHTIHETVMLSISQNATMERDAFWAGLGIRNRMPDKNINNVQIKLQIKGNAGLANDKFFIQAPRLKGISNIDGSGVVSPLDLAKAQWLMIPKPGAGGVNPEGTKYNISANISYSVNGVNFEIATQEVEILVKPQPEIVLDYFIPSDVIANKPFKLAVKATNEGYGPARNFSIETAQPVIYYNPSGLLIDFEIIRSQLEGQERSTSLKVNFGNIKPGEGKLAWWDMVTSLDGTFTEFTGEYMHSSELGGMETSLIKKINTYIIQKQMGTGEIGYDFLANSKGDENFYMLFNSSNGNSTFVNRANYTVANMPTPQNPELNVSLEDYSGQWVIISLEDPYGNKVPIEKVIRTGDGTEIPSYNYWMRNGRILIVDHFDEGFDGKYTIIFKYSNLVPVITTNRTMSDGKIVVEENKAINFRGSESYDVFGGIVSYKWEFGDGTEATGENVEHIYSQIGEYQVNLTITNNAIISNTTSVKINVVRKVLEVAILPVWFSGSLDSNQPISVLKDRAKLVDNYYIEQSYKKVYFVTKFPLNEKRIQLEPLATYGQYPNNNPDNDPNEGNIILSAIDNAKKYEPSFIPENYDAILVVTPELFIRPRGCPVGCSWPSVPQFSYGTAIVNDLSTYGMWAHELGHAAFGFPDIYAGSNFGDIGKWGLMGEGSGEFNDWKVLDLYKLFYVNVNPPTIIDPVNKLGKEWIAKKELIYGETTIDLEQYGENYYFIKSESSDGIEYIIEGRWPPDGIKEDSLPTNLRNTYPLDKTKGILLYTFGKNKLYVIPHNYRLLNHNIKSDNNKVTLVPGGWFEGDTYSDYKSQLEFHVTQNNNQLYLNIIRPKISSRNVVSLSFVNWDYSNIYSLPSNTTTKPDIDLRMFSYDGKMIGMNYSLGEYEMSIESVNASGNILGGGPEWIAYPSSLSLYSTIDPTPLRKWAEESNVTLSNITAEMQVVQYDENGTRTESKPMTMNVSLENPTVVELPTLLPPVISNVSVSIRSDSALITWDTNKEADSLINYGTSSEVYIFSSHNTNIATNHSFKFEGLAPNTHYYFVVNSTDIQGNSNQSIEYSFRTSDINPPESIENIGTYDIGTTWLNFTWLNPPDPDFNHTELYLNGTFLTNVYAPQNYYNITGLTPDTSYELGTHTVDTSGNINETWVNKTVKTASASSAPIHVTNPSVSPAIILNDNGRARPPGTNFSRLNITVTGNISSVTIDLSPIGGSATAPMTRIQGTNNYTITTNATAGINLTDNLVVNTTDINGNFNNSVSIPLTVLLRGDIVRDNKIDLKDLLYMRKYLAGLEPSINPLVADIQPAEGDGKVDLKDLLFLRKYLAGLEPLI